MTRAAPIVPRLWPGATIVCLGTGPSLTAADVTRCAGQAKVIAINDAYRLAPWADVLYACDAKWWRWNKGLPGFAGLKFGLDTSIAYRDVTVLQNTGLQGLETTPTGLRTGHTSGYQAINLAVHLGAARIVLLGYDFKGDHFFGSHPDQTKPPFELCLRRFGTLVEPLAALGVTVLNATRQTALLTFPRVALEDVFAEVAA